MTTEDIPNMQLAIDSFDNPKARVAARKFMEKLESREITKDVLVADNEINTESEMLVRKNK